MAAQAKTLLLLLACCCLPAYSHAYLYDALNRIESVTESGAASWSRTYSYDRYGNRAVGASGLQVGSLITPTVLNAYDASTNRLTGSWANYDDAGNMTSFLGSGGQWSADYDAENKQRFYYCNAGMGPACQDSNADAEYVYDGEGNRVQKLTPGVTMTYVYDAFGRLATEYTVGGPSETAGTFYRTTDHLGSTRLVTDSSGAVVSRRDFFPFGDQIDADGTSGRIISGSGYNEEIAFPQLFTAKERDDESGLDYFGARYMSSALGRFTSVDPENAGAMVVNPQSWNGYAYVNNNPLRLVDPNGESAWDVFEGLSNSLGSNALAGAGRVDKPNNRDFKLGQAVGDAASVFVGLANIANGSNTTLGGGMLAATGGGAAPGLAISTAGATQVAVGATQVVTGLGNLIAAAQNSGGTDSEGAGGESQEPSSADSPDTGKPGSQRNPDGTSKNPLDQLDEIEGAQRRNRDAIEDISKSQQRAKKFLRDIKSLDDLDEDF